MYWWADKTGNYSLSSWHEAKCAVASFILGWQTELLMMHVQRCSLLHAQSQNRWLDHSIITLEINRQSRQTSSVSPCMHKQASATRDQVSSECLHCCCGCRICGGWWAERRPGRNRWSPLWCRRCLGKGSFPPSRKWCSGSSSCDHQSWARGNLITCS